MWVGLHTLKLYIFKIAMKTSSKIYRPLRDRDVPLDCFGIVLALAIVLMFVSFLFIQNNQV